MRMPSPRLIVGGGIALIATVLALFGIATHRPTSSPRPTAVASVTANGVTLASQRMELPSDDATLPPGPHADLVTASCTACHSASMILTQPPLSADQWKAEVTKMREAYKAPVPEGDVPTILAYLQTLPGQGGQ